MKYGQFTAKGSQKVELRIETLVDQLIHLLKSNFHPDEYTQVIINGGYGRGEGGVEIENGVEKPHNNIDLIFITPLNSSKQLNEIQVRLNKLLKPLGTIHGIELDTFVINENKLKKLPCLVMLYDMQYGHKSILGEKNVFADMPDYGPEDILASDVRNLLINRGTLLLINDWLLRRGNLNKTEKKLIIKHIIKAIIGYGDALLFSRGDYHWSYLEKQRRMSMSMDIPKSIRKLYCDAMDFRFEPDYERYLKFDLVSWNQDVLDQLTGVHLDFERWRLKQTNLIWEDYPEEAFKQALTESWKNPRVMGRKMKQFFKKSSHSRYLSIQANLGLKTIDSSGLLGVLYPVIAYHQPLLKSRNLAQELLNARTSTREDLLSAYLYCWGALTDQNLFQLLNKLQLNFEPIKQEVKAS